MISNNYFADIINSPVRALMGRVEIYNGSTLTLVCGCHDRLKEFIVERLGEGKFFGYGVCQKINVKLLDPNRELSITTANSIEVEFGKGTEYIYPFPRFFVSEVHRDERTNELSVTAYDALYNAAKYTVADLGITGGYTIAEFATMCAAKLGLPIAALDSSFNTAYVDGANFDGTESIREALNAVAEATQTIYFIDWDWKLTFKRLSNEAAAALVIDKEKYFDLDTGENRRLGAICHTTELGDNVIVSTAASGTTQYVRNNPFYDMRDDIGELLDSAIAAVGGLTIAQFNCNWRGNFLLEIGDKIELVTRDNNKAVSYLLNDSLTFDGTLSQVTEWQYEDNELETESNPNTLGDALKLTYARVDKANKQIELVASDVAANSESISTLELNTDSISASVSNLETTTTEALEGVNGSISELNTRVAATMTSEEVRLEIQTELSNGVSKVETNTGFTFNDDGLTVSKSDSEMNTTITENGMTVYKNNEAVLVANNAGVDAVNLNASTYLIIGTNSRFENYGSNRTGCFWIGG